MGAVPQFGLMGNGGYWYPPNSLMFFYTITKWSHKKNGLTAPTILANISQMEQNKTNSVWCFFWRLGLKISRGNTWWNFDYFCSLWIFLSCLALIWNCGKSKNYFFHFQGFIDASESRDSYYERILSPGQCGEDK